MAGAGDHPSNWSALRLGKTKGCRISDQAALKDCSTFFFKDAPKSLELGGDDNVEAWQPKIVNVPLLKSNKWEHPVRATGEIQCSPNGCVGAFPFLNKKMLLR